jgi:hypothetical protein
MSKAPDLNDEEVSFLQRLRDGKDGIAILGTGNNRYSRLVEFEYVETQSASMDTIHYAITEKGRRALKAIEQRQALGG